MTRQLFRILALLGLAAGLSGFALPAYAGKRVALVVGNNDYRNVPKLLKAVNDARTMGDTLKQLGFSVMVAENQSRQQFSETLLAFDRAIEPGDTAFFFYAGHGFEIAGQNYLLPTDVPAATEGQEELVRDASILADRIVERLQNKKARTSILVFDACRNNPFERKGTRAVSGGGGLAPMVQLPEGVFSVFSAGPRQTALDRLSNDDANPNSVFTRTFAKELLQPGENLVQVAQRTRRLVSEMADTVKHRQVPVYFDQMVDDVFLSGVANDTVAAAPRPADPPAQKLAALPPVSVPRVPKEETTNAPIASFSRHNGGWSVVFSFADPTLGISWRMARQRRFPRNRLHRFARPAHAQEDAEPIDRIAAGRCGRHHRDPLCRPVRRHAGAVPDQVRSRGRADPRPAQDPRHDRDELAVIPRVQRAAGLLHAPRVLSLCHPRGAHRHRHRRSEPGVEDAGLRPARSQRDQRRHAALHEARAGNAVHLGGADLSRRQRVGDQELPQHANRSNN
ncbi:hypothetical protein ACVWW2_004489 [Bradyrhizobium sp. LM4.3]